MKSTKHVASAIVMHGIRFRMPLKSQRIKKHLYSLQPYCLPRRMTHPLNVPELKLRDARVLQNASG